VADNKKITVAYRESSVPFSYLEGPEKPIGFAVDISNAIVDAVRKQTQNARPHRELAGRDLANRIPLLQNGTIDLECGSTTNNSARGKDVDFAINHFYTGTRLLVKKSSGIKNYADLKGKTVASTTGTTNAGGAQVQRGKELGINIVSTRTTPTALLVEADRAAAFAMDDILLFGLKANAKNPASLEVVGDSLQVEPYACMIRKNDPKFKALVDGVITGMMKSGEFEKLYNKWFMSAHPAQEPEPEPADEQGAARQPQGDERQARALIACVAAQAAALACW
jgi:glutamate/aspartate transport system substrate-binding protein